VNSVLNLRFPWNAGKLSSGLHLVAYRIMLSFIEKVSNVCIYIYIYMVTTGAENRQYSRRDPSCWPRDTFYYQKLALISSTGGGRSAGVCSWTQATEFLGLFLVKNWVIYFLPLVPMSYGGSTGKFIWRIYREWRREQERLNRTEKMKSRIKFGHGSVFPSRTLWYNEKFNTRSHGPCNKLPTTTNLSPRKHFGVVWQLTVSFENLYAFSVPSNNYLFSAHLKGGACNRPAHYRRIQTRRRVGDGFQRREGCAVEMLPGFLNFAV
jgi:hypothetical protein